MKKPFFTMNGKEEVGTIVDNNGFVDIGPKNQPATSVDPKKPWKWQEPRGPQAIR